MTAIDTGDAFSTLDGFGSSVETAGRGGYGGQQGPELLEHRAGQLDPPPRMVFGATTFREVADVLVPGDDPLTQDEWNQRTLRAPATVISFTLTETLGRPDATIVDGAEDLDLQLLENRTPDGRTHELVYRPTRH